MTKTEMTPQTKLGKDLQVGDTVIQTDGKPVKITNLTNGQEADQSSGGCDLCGEPLNSGERFTHKDCSDYENFLASL